MVQEERREIGRSHEDGGQGKGRMENWDMGKEVQKKMREDEKGGKGLRERKWKK